LLPGEKKSDRTYFLVILITFSGQIIVQLPQPMHLDVSVTPAIWKPLSFTLSEIIRIFLGQTETQSPHPMQSSSVNSTLDLMLIRTLPDLIHLSEYT